MKSNFKFYAEELPACKRRNRDKKWKPIIEELLKLPSGVWYVIHEYNPEVSSCPAHFIRTQFGNQVEIVQRKVNGVGKVYARVKTPGTTE